MKKSTVFIILGAVLLFLLLLVFGGIFLFTSLNKEKDPITASQFQTIMQQKGFVVQDATSQFSDYDYITKVYIALSSDSNYQIEFYELSDSDYATSFYNNNKSIFESSKGSSNAETHAEIANYSKYTLSSNGKFKVISRIDNTALYLNVDSSNKKAVEDILKDLGY